MATFGELLQELRKDHRLSQKQLADVIAVTKREKLLEQYEDAYFNVNGPESMREDLIKVAQGVKFSHKNGCVFPIQLSLYM